MNLFLFLTIAALWLINSFIDYNEFSYHWQLKEYRLDRIRDFISTKQGRAFLRSYLILGRIIIFIILIFLFIYQLIPTAISVLILLTLEILRNGYNFYKKRFRHPKFTAKAILIILLSVGLELLLWYFTNNVILMLMVLCLRSILSFLIVGLLNIPTLFIKHLHIILASKKMLHFPNVVVIGITGSYGKTTVKTFLSQILRVKYNAIATPKNINTEIGIAKFIKKTDFTDVEIFIVEMGAYRMNEIKLICEMVRPSIGILTAINEQHLSLFGSLENTQKAKSELLFSLPKSGLAIINNDNKYCRELIERLECPIQTFGQQTEFSPTIKIKDLITINERLYFSAVVKEAGAINEYKLESAVVGEHNAMNIAPCFLAARRLGIEDELVIEQIKKLYLPEKTLNMINYGESIIINDSYNSNPDGFASALKFLDNKPGEFKKIVITRGMLELGGKSQELHQKIGKLIAVHADELVIINDNFEADLRAGVDEKIKVNLIYNPNELVEYVKKLKNIKAVILLENLVPDKLIDEINESK